MFLPTEITCPDPSIQIKGSIGLLVATSTLSIGGAAHYRCERGYSLQGNQTRTCMPKGQWNGAPPVCIRKYCIHRQVTESIRSINVALRCSYKRCDVSITVINYRPQIALQNLIISFSFYSHRLQIPWHY